MRIHSRPIGLPLAIALTATAAIAAPPAHPARGKAHRTAPAPAAATASTGGVVQLATNRGRLVTLARPMSDLFVANSDIADVQVRSPTQLYIFGKKPGETTLSATSKTGQVVYAATIRVGNNFDSIGQMLKLAMPEAQITATTMNGVVLLTGTVAQPDDGAEAERLVTAFVGEGTKVISRLRTATPLQVNLQVRFAEVSRSYLKNVGSNLMSRTTGSGFQFGVSSGRSGFGTLPGQPNSTGTGTSTSYTYTQSSSERTTAALAGHLLGMDVLQALDLGERIGQVTSLANPNLTALSGETGTFLAGGEIPIPIAQGLGAVSIEYKQYGVSLAYTPTVLADGRISLRVRPEVSQLSSDGAITFSGTTIPGITTRRAETTVELGSGQSFMIAGLLQNTHNNSIDKTPGVGDLPVLGALFRSNSFQRNETELVIVITPYLVKPVNANDIVLPTDGYKAPTDLDRILFGQLGGGTSGASRPKPTMEATPAQPGVGAAPPLPVPAPADQRRDDAAATPRPKDKASAASAAAPGFSLN